MLKERTFCEFLTTALSHEIKRVSDASARQFTLRTAASFAIREHVPNNFLVATYKIDRDHDDLCGRKSEGLVRVKKNIQVHMAY